MRGWPGDFPTAPHKGRPPAALPQKAPSHSGPGGGRGSRGPAHPTWPPPSRACVHRGRSCPLTTAGPGGPQGWALGGSLFSHPSQPSTFPIGSRLAQFLGAWEKSLWGDPSHSLCCHHWAAPPPLLPATRAGLASPCRHASLLPSLACTVLTPHLLPCPPCPSCHTMQVTGGKHGGVEGWQDLFLRPQLPPLRCGTALSLPWACGGPGKSLRPAISKYQALGVLW